MLSNFKVGDQKTLSVTVEEKDIASFEAGNVHPVYATFALGRDAEWTCRLFVLEMKEEDEEGIGTLLTIEHASPAMLGSKVDFIAEIESLNGNEIICRYEAKVEGRLIAFGRQGQKILKKQKIDLLFSNLS